MSEPEAPKIIVDSDWKSQAQAEKERLAREAEKNAAKPAGPPQGPGDGSGGEALPPADFNSLMGTLITQALMYLGAFPDPEGRAMVSLEHARFHIDLLGVLEEKTRGNVSEEESADLKRALSELRLRYVEISKAVTEMIARERAGGGGARGGVAGGGRPPSGGMPAPPGI